MSARQWLEIEDLPVGVAITDQDDRILHANAAFLRWMGAEDLTGRRLGDLVRRANDFLEGAEPDGDLVLHSGDPERAALIVRTPHEAGVIVTLLDASHRWAAGRQLRGMLGLADRTRNRLQLVIDASIAFGQATTEERLTQILADTTAQAYAAEESAVYLDDGGGLFALTAGTNPLGAFVEAARLTSAASSLRRVIKVSSAEEGDVMFPMLGRAMNQAGVQAMIAAPLHHDGLTHGVFACFFHHPRTFDDEAAPLAEALANQATQTLLSVRLQHSLEHAAMHDETTGLPNRRLLEEQSTGAGSREVAVVFVDLDGFKTVNDRLGHEQGDEVLREVGRRLRTAVRVEDVVARYGGDEFIIVCESTDEAGARDVAERVRQAVAEPYSFLAETIPLGASIGIAVGTVYQSVAPLDRLIRAADHAMYQAKAAGGNRITVSGASAEHASA